MTVTARQLKCLGMFITQGYPLSGSAAIGGNLCRESGPDLPSAFRKTKLDHGSNGLPQWRLERLTNYQNFVKAQQPKASAAELWEFYGNMQLQVDFIVHELRTDYPALDAKLRKGGDVAALTADFCWQFERPSKALSGIDIRIAYAKALATAGGKAQGTTKNPLIAKADFTVVDHLQAQADSHAKQQQGGIVMAAISGVGAGGLALSHFAEGIPMWELVAFGLLAVLVLVGIIGSQVQAHKASDVRLAIAGATPDAPAAADVEHTPVLAPVPDTSTGTTISDPAFADAVQAEVARQLAAMSPPRIDSPATQGTVGLSGAILDKDGKPVVSSN